MNKEIFNRLNIEGFIKTTDKPAQDIPDDQKVILNRKGNILFNEGNFEGARRIFMTTGYSDGLIRIADSYMKNEKPLEALKMYYLAHDKKSSDALLEKIALIIQNLLKEEEK